MLFRSRPPARLDLTTRKTRQCRPTSALDRAPLSSPSFNDRLALDRSGHEPPIAASRRLKRKLLQHLPHPLGSLSFRFFPPSPPASITMTVRLNAAPSGDPVRRDHRYVRGRSIRPPALHGAGDQRARPSQGQVVYQSWRRERLSKRASVVAGGTRGGVEARWPLSDCSQGRLFGWRVETLPRGLSVVPACGQRSLPLHSYSDKHASPIPRW